MVLIIPKIALNIFILIAFILHIPQFTIYSYLIKVSKNNNFLKQLIILFNSGSIILLVFYMTEKRLWGLIPIFLLSN